MNKKEVSINRVVKSIITGFASYGIIFYILTILILVLGNYMVARNVTSLNGNTARIVLSVVFALFIFFMIRFTCRLSTMDVFKKCVINKESHIRISKKISVFYIICIALCIFTGLALLNANLKYAREEIEYYKVYYSSDNSFSQEHIDMLNKENIERYNEKRNTMVTSTIIIELGLTFGFLSLINYQGKMLERYNEYAASEANNTGDEKMETNMVEENKTEENQIEEKTQETQENVVSE